MARVTPPGGGEGEEVYGEEGGLECLVLLFFYAAHISFGESREGELKVYWRGASQRSLDLSLTAYSKFTKEAERRQPNKAKAEQKWCKK